MAKKQKKNKRQVKKQKTALVVSAPVVQSLQLNQTQKLALAARTPQEFVKTRKGRGGKTLSYVEGGYVVARLNQVFGPLNWSWEEMRRESSDRKVEKSSSGEVTVHGRLTIIDHIKGYKVWKEADGQHPIHDNVPLGDAYKSANTDALKKAASLFGIAMDVYWQQFDEPSGNDDKPTRGSVPTPPTQTQLFEYAKRGILQMKDVAMLAEMQQKVMTSKLYSAEQKKELLKIIHEKAGE